MLISKPKFYTEFKCIADKCKESCCKGWQIVIDDDSLENYKELASENAGNTADICAQIASNIDFKESCFKQNGICCAFLNQNGLCDLQSVLGEEALCDTCKRYPRHMEEFENVREYSLSLSCPVAANIMLSQSKPWEFVEEENDDFDDDYEDFDFFMYDKLVSARDIIFKIINNDHLSLQIKLKMILKLSNELQQLVDDDELGEAEKLFESWENVDSTTFDMLENKLENSDNNTNNFFSIYINETELDDFERMKARFSSLYNLELLNPGWTRVLDETWDKFYDRESTAEELFNEVMNNEKYLKNLTNILMFFIHTYFCGAVYDDEIYSKAALAVYSTIWIAQIEMSHKFEDDDFENLCMAAVKYAREVEHSDLNLDLIEEALR